MNLQNKKHTINAGFTLVELLIVLGLSAVLSAALTQIVIGNKRNILLTDSYAKTQESSRIAMDYLAKDFRMAGYLGCTNRGMADVTVMKNLLKPTDPQFKPIQHSFLEPITGVDNYDHLKPEHEAFFTGISNTSIKPLDGTDILINSSALATDLLSSNTPVSTDNSFKVVGPANQIAVLKGGGVLMLTDCSGAHIFSASKVVYQTSTTAEVFHDIAVPTTTGIDNTQVQFDTLYDPGSQVLIMNTTIYFIAPSVAIPGRHSLYRASNLNGGLPEELVPYIEDMQLLFGTDTDNDFSPDSYLSAQQIAKQINDTADPLLKINMGADVYSINVELIVSGEVNVGSPPLSGVDSAGNAFQNDGKLRKRYAQLINIRNAGLASF